LVGALPVKFKPVTSRYNEQHLTLVWLLTIFSRLIVFVFFWRHGARRTNGLSATSPRPLHNPLLLWAFRFNPLPKLTLFFQLTLLIYIYYQ
jgi:hypothetical protein